MRRSSHTPSFTQGGQEPLIVVEESENNEKEEEASTQSSQRQSLDIDSPENPYLLSPWRETRKHSLPTPPCTSGITASQVRRLSERGGEGSGPSPREQAFLATLYSTPAPQPGGRRHSVVTISRVPPTMFGRSRRESIAALPAGQRSNANSRRESNTGPPPSTDHRGSIHNLQLDIMDDIVQARKARMKLWNTSNERVCEVQTLDEAGTGSSSPMRYTNRRYSDFVGTALPPIQSFRRASEMPLSPCGAPLTPASAHTPVASAAAAAAAAATAAAAANASTTPAAEAPFKPKTKMGIVCTNTDLISLLSSLASSATEINRCGEKELPSPLASRPFPLKSVLKSPTSTAASSSGSGAASLEPKSNLQKNRSNSFDISLYQNIKQLATGGTLVGGGGGGGAGGGGSTDPEKSFIESGWFIKRHQPMARRKSSAKSPSATVTFARETLDKLRDKEPAKDEPKPKPKSESRSPLNKLKWDGRSAIVDARMIGHAIENFITGSSSSSSSSSSGSSSKKAAGGGKDGSGSGRSGAKKSPASSWFGKADDDEDSNDTCDSSLCSTLKDLFVK
ncbi:AGAP000460-PA-like protein [Anopheles sinensis]|uniref:AGAP000460-PA-like protein n=1 Tax=Anopheles sinensis TaxID=74873 RepID=A0A084VLS4_ANOSI|nr:AGAP000460-PA-like protein [Anopheles sinensis]